MDEGSKKIKQKAARVCLIQRHKWIILTQEYLLVCTCRNYPLKKNHFICVQIYGATILNCQLTKVTVSTLHHPQQRRHHSCALKKIDNYPFTEQIWLELDETQRKGQVGGQSQIKAMRDTWQCLHPQDKSGTVAERLSLLASSLLHPPCCFCFTCREMKSMLGLVSFMMTCAHKHDLCPWQWRDISVRLHRFIVLLMFVQKKKKSTD